MTTPKAVVPPIDGQISEALQVYAGLHHELDIFLSGVGRWFSSHPLLTTGDPPLVHSVKARLKDPTHLAEKLRRKYVRDNQLCFPPAELGLHITDLAGLRVMHLHQLQFANIHKAIMKKVGDADWHLMEPVKAYTWDPESRTYFESLELECQVKESFYTSVHYVLRPRQESQIACEVQVRTLFEEIWGEVDHSLNYPTATDNLSCKVSCPLG